MKTKLVPVVCYMLLTCYSINSNAQNANRTLSNLNSPTAVNQSLIPGTNNTINLGSGGRGGLNWNNLYLGNAIYFEGDITIHAPGKGNFFAGTKAGNTSLTGQLNTGIGQASLSKLTSGGGNTANGSAALANNTTGNSNVAIGDDALFYNTIGIENTANGAAALNNNTTGNDNTASGYAALGNNTTGGGNTANGSAALVENTAGYDNVAIGNHALFHNTTGIENTGNGKSALYTNTFGNNNTALGSFADVSTGYLNNATAIGSNAVVDASDKVQIGDGSVKSIGGQVGWSIFSDGRYKKDIKENVAGLAFINSLRPITYTVNVQGLNEYYNKGRKQLSNNEFSDKEDEAVNAEMKKAEDEASKIVYNGFIAQEVESAAKKLNFEFSGVDKPQSKDGLYGLRYDNFVVPLVKAVQELSKMSEGLLAENDAKDAAINSLKSEIQNLKSEMNELKAIVHSGNWQSVISNQSISDIQLQTFGISSASLQQNIPNPFHHTTTIVYSLPPKYNSAQIIITDKSGKIIKQVNITGKGRGTLNVEAATLSSGAYQYSLYVDGKLINTKQMLLEK